MLTKLRHLWKSAKWVLADRSNHYLARLHRSRLKHVTFVAVSGSAGKTTTKDLGTAVLAKLGPCHKSEGTFNRHQRLDDMVRATLPTHRFCVLEASAEHPGYLDRSLRVIQPSISVLTLVAREHYSAFKSLEAIAAEKGKLVTALPPNGVAVLNIDDPLIREIGERHPGRVVWVGKSDQATVRLLDCSSSWPDPLILRVEYQKQVYEVRTSLHGTHLALSVISAIGIGIAAGLELDHILAALTEAEPVEGRMRLERSSDGVVFVRDDWKAPQWSLPAPLQFMKDARAVRKVVILGSISDSPKSPSQRYTHAAREALQVSDLVVLIGPQVLAAAKLEPPANKSLKTFATITEAASFLRTELRRGDLVLLKGTNKQDHLVRLLMDRERAVECWRHDCGIQRFCNNCHFAYTSSVKTAQGESSSSIEGQQIVAGSFIVVGLGNEGPEYRNTPHNVGQRALDMLAESHGSAWEQHPEGWVSTIQVNGVGITLLKPAGKMNVCGPIIARFLARANRSAAETIVIHDDMDLELGQCRVKQASGDGGHKGVRSVITALGTNVFPRVRLGVRRSSDSRAAKQIVLEPFSREDGPALDTAFAQVESGLEPLIARKHAHAAVLESAA
jgi:UDP-N-acetylmuramoyl-tripeptide--D-alanyl-D-alanine ligase